MVKGNNGRRMSPASIGGGFHFRLSVVGYNPPLKPGGAEAPGARCSRSLRPWRASTPGATLRLKYVVFNSAERIEKEAVRGFFNEPNWNQTEYLHMIALEECILSCNFVQFYL